MSEAMSSAEALVQELLENRAVIEILDSQPSAGTSSGGAVSIAGIAANVLDKGINGLAAGTGRGENCITAQFNPSTVKYSASASEGDASAAEGNLITRTVTSYCSVKMTVELLFYRRYPLDDSVEKQIGRMLSFMIHSKGRCIRFSWANMVMEGEVESFSGEYNMFDTFGSPVSGKVDLTISSKSTIKQVSRMYQNLSQPRPQQTDSGITGV